MLQDADADDGAAASGRLIGPWRLLHEIARGGMGTVVAGPSAPTGQYEQRAALKLIKRGMTPMRSRALLAGGGSSRRSNIPYRAVLDGGIAADGRPYSRWNTVR